MQLGEWIGLCIGVAIAVTLAVILILAIRNMTVRWYDLPGHPGCKYAWRYEKGEVAKLLKAFEAASACIRQYVKMPSETIDAALSSALIVAYPTQKVPNPNYPRILGESAEVWGVSWGKEIWIGSGYEALCHELCHSIFGVVGEGDHSKFAEFGAYAAIDAYEASIRTP
jgi:hypothetical protein